MKKISLKEYAQKEKMSLFQAMKMVKSGKIAYEEIEQDGKNILYVLFDENSESMIQENDEKHEEEKKINMKEEIAFLSREIKALRDEVEKLKEKI